MTDQHTGGVRIAPGVTVADKALDLSYSSSSGPGGQNVNKRATKCTLRLALDSIPLRPSQRHRLEAIGSTWLTASGEFIIQADEHRSQERNREACFERLRELIVACLKEPKIRRKTRPSKGAKQRRLTEKKVRGEIKRSRRDEE